MCKYNDFDELDRLFFDDVLEVIRKKYGKKPLELMESSTFLKKYKEDPAYVQHHPPVYWADFIYEQVNTERKRSSHKEHKKRKVGSRPLITNRRKKGRTIVCRRPQAPTA